jgi:hypothetical protein
MEPASSHEVWPALLRMTERPDDVGFLSSAR